MTQITGGEALARCLAQEGIRFVFGLPCPEIDPLLAALEPNGIRLVPVRHEAAGAYMATGLYKTTGQVAAVLGNPGPGSANLLPGVITARHEGVPLVAITSQHRLGIVYPSPPTTFQGQDQLGVFAPAVKWGGPIFAYDRITEVTRLSFREMWTGRPGPVHLEVPAPILYETGEESALRLLPPERYRPGLALASETQLEQAAELLAGAARPAVIAGAGVDRADAQRSPVAAGGAARLPRTHQHGGTLHGARRPRTLCVRLRRSGRPGSTRGRRSARRRLAARQPRPSIRQVLGRSGDAADRADRRGSTKHRRVAPHRARHRGGRPCGARGARGARRQARRPARAFP